MLRREALDWNRLTMAGRASRMTATALDYLDSSRSAARMNGTDAALRYDDTDFAVSVRSIPEPLSVGAAREYFGQSFRNDFKLEIVDAGPLHVVLCSRTVTEAKSRSLFGVDDDTS